MTDESPEGRKRLRDMPVSRLFPNMVTLGGLCCGVTAIRFAMAGKFEFSAVNKWEIAVTFILAAAVLDAMDGMVARLLKATSNFGAQLDSLSDVICFGVTPALVYYLWELSDLRRYGWAAALIYIVCCALRLARFNAMLQGEQIDKELSRRFFTGVPAPAGALLALLPLMASFEAIDIFAGHGVPAALYLTFIGLLMASRIPTFAAKGLRFRQDNAPYVMLGAAFLLICLVIEPWLTLLTCGVLYLASLPLSTLAYRRALRLRRI